MFSEGGSVRVFDAATGKKIFRRVHDGEVRAVAFSSDGTRVATGSHGKSRSDGGSARVFDAEPVKRSPAWTTTTG